MSSSSPSSRSPRRRVVIALFVASLAVLAGTCVVVGSLYLDDRRAALETAAAERLDLLASGRADVVATWRDGLVRQPDEIVNADTIRLFVTEAANADAGGELPVYLLPQRSYVVTALDEFVSRNGLAHARLLGPKGEILATSTDAPDFPAEQTARARAHIEGTASTLAVLRPEGGRVLLDLHVRVERSAQGLGDAGPAAGALVMTLDPAGALAGFLAPAPWFGGAERFTLTQQEPVSLTLARTAQGAIETVPDETGGGDRYTAHAAVRDTGWTVKASMPAATVLAPLEGARDAVITVSAAAFIFLLLIMLAAWLNQTRQFNEALAAEYSQLARKIDHRRRLLERINNAITDGIALRDADGVYVHANPAFARLIGRAPGDIVGARLEDLFAPPVAERVATVEGLLVRREVPIAVPARISEGDRKRDLDIVPVPLRDADGRPERWLTVVHDRTEEREARRRRDHAAAQTVVVYMKSIELADEWLHGQGVLVREVAMLLAERLELSNRDRETIRVAASLCQIGKLFIPRDILRKEGPLTPVELEAMQGHVASLLKLVEGMDFGFPVQKVLATMHERLNGSGYPDGVEGPAIGMPARVLGLTEAFCALVRPRPWRPARTPQSAMSVLNLETDLYDTHVLAALHKAVDDGSVGGIMERVFGREADAHAPG